MATRPSAPPARAGGDLFSKRFVVIAGKGGVGRTTVAAAIALAAVRRGKRVLLAQVNAKERLSGLLGVGEVTHEIQEVEPGLSLVNMNPRAAIREYALMVLRFQAVYRAVFENRMVKSFLRAIPGLDDWSMIGKAWYHTTERIGDEPRFDLVILDGPATGHLISLLGMPRTVLEAVPKGPMTRDATAMLELLTDPARCAVEIVTLPEEMPVNEAADLYRALALDLKLSMGHLIVNRVLPPRFQGEDLETALRTLETEQAQPGAPRLPPSLATALGAARLRRIAQWLQRGYLTRLGELVALPPVTLPYVFAPAFGREQVEALSHLLERALGPMAKSSAVGQRA